MAYAQNYDDPQMDPMVRQRVLQKLQGPDASPSGAPPPTPPPPAPPSGNAPLTPNGDPRVTTQRSEDNPTGTDPLAVPPSSSQPGTSPTWPNQPPGFNPNPPSPPPNAPSPVFQGPSSVALDSPDAKAHSLWTDTWNQSQQNPQQFVQNVIQKLNLVGHQTDPTALTQIANALNSLGVDAKLNKDPHGYYKGLDINGQFVKMLDGSDRWIWDEGGAGAANAAAGSSSAVPAGFGNTSNPFLDQIRQWLKDRIGADMQPVDENASYISQPMSAARNEASRSSDAERKALAEHLYASGGLQSNALETGIRQSGEKTALGLGTLKAQLIQREYQGRRADLAQALQVATASGDVEMARQVQMQLAQLDAMLRREGFGVSLAEFGQNQNNNTVNQVS